MLDRTAEKIAKNEATFRDANERISATAQAYDIDGAVPFICECAETGCHEIVRLTLDEYRHVRSNARWFVNVTGHEAASGQAGEVAERHDGYVITAKIGRAGEIVERPESPTRD